MRYHNTEPCLFHWMSININDRMSLSGKTINTNASWISKKLFNWRIVLSHLTIPDDKRITDTLNLLFSSDIDFIICTGGLL